MQPFDLILLVVIGDLVQQGVTQNDLSVTGLMLVIATVALLQVGASYLSYRFRNLRRERLTVDDVNEEMRLSSITSLDEVRWGVLETSGRVSFIKKEA